MTARDHAPAGPPVRTVRIELSLRSLFSILAIALGLWVFVQIWQILLVLVIALVLAGSLSPVVDLMERRRFRRGIALGIVLLGLVGAVVGLGFLVVPALIAQISGLVTNAPDIQRRLADQLAGLPGPLARYADTVRHADPERYLSPIGAYALSYATAAVELITYGLTTVVLAFYLIADRERVLGFAYALIPRRFHVRTARVLLDMETIVGGYVRGQALTSLLIGLFVFGLLRFMGVPNALALAIFAAFTDLIPFIGGVLVITPCVLAALSLGPGPAAIVFVAIIVYQEFESRVIVPRVYGKTLRLSPVAVTIALLIGGKLLGIVGALLALPIAAGLRVLVEDLRIELPGEQPGEEAQRAHEEQAEAFYEERALGSSSVEAAVIATELAGQLKKEEEDSEGTAEVPIEERQRDGGRGALDVPNPART